MCFGGRILRCVECAQLNDDQWYWTKVGSSLYCLEVPDSPEGGGDLVEFISLTTEGVKLHLQFQLARVPGFHRSPATLLLPKKLGSYVITCPCTAAQILSLACHAVSDSDFTTLLHGGAHNGVISRRRTELICCPSESKYRGVHSILLCLRCTYSVPDRFIWCITRCWDM